MNFIDNKYTRWYYHIISIAKQNPATVFEKHHIIPKSLGGDNDSSNIVKLSFKQHFICHKLLTKMLLEPNDRRKMVYALHMMSVKSKNHCRTSKSYEYTRQLRRLLGVSDETRRKMSQSMIGKNLGNRISDDGRTKMSIAAKSRKPVSENTRKKISERLKREWAEGKRKDVPSKVVESRKNTWTPPMLGRSHSEETKQKISVARLKNEAS